MRLGPLDISAGGFLTLLMRLLSTRNRQIATGGSLVGLLVLIRWWQRRSSSTDVSGKAGERKKAAVSRGNVDALFWKRLVGLLKLIFPTWKSMEIVNLGMLSVLLVVRTSLSISISTLNGRIVKAIVGRDFTMFIKRLINLAMYSVPASLVNSGLDYLNHKLAIQFRTRLTLHLNQRYLQGMAFYKMSNLDSRITSADQRLTQDIDRWARCLSNLYSNVSKPVLDLVLFSMKLSELVGWEGPAWIIFWYFISGIVIRFISPPFGLLTAREQRLEGVFRTAHSSLVANCEEIAFYNGNSWEKNRISSALQTLVSHINSTLSKRFFMGTVDSMIVKYGAFISAYGVLGLPVFGPNRHKYFAKIGNDPSAITRDYIRNSSMLMNLTKAIGRIVVSYKDFQQLAGFTTLVSEMMDVMDDLGKGQISRTMVEGCPYNNTTRGTYELCDFIRFEDVPIVTPNGDVLVEKLNFEIKAGMHTFIQGPNGCGKSSLFRILGELWPLFGGKLCKPPMDQLFYIPQRPYLPTGSLRDQIIYPHTPEQMGTRGISDADLQKLLEVVNLPDLAPNRGGFNQVEEWNDTLSGGQKQRVAMCRLLYHQPKFAILDECTSAVSSDAEGAIYQHFKKCGITLITVSHRESLMKYHEYALKLDGERGWDFVKIIH